MPTNAQRRQTAKRKLERQVSRRQERAQRRRRTLRLGAIGAAVLVVVVVVVVVVLVVRPSGSSAPTAAAPGAPSACTYSTGSEPASRPVTPPDGNPPTTGSVALTLQTNQGAIPLTLDRAQAPCAVNAVVSLAQQKFYDDTPCHRLTTGEGLKVLQCGDPSGSGSGGPGYAYGQEPVPPGAGYTRGTIAMANTGQPDSTGSQFFLVYADSQLPPDYSVVGHIGAPGLAVLDKVAAAGSDDGNGPGDGKPKTPVQIQQATLAAS